RFTDPGFDRPAAGTRESFTLSLDWGDGVVQPLTASVVQGDVARATTGTFSASHSYARGGLYLAKLVVRDDDDGEASASFRYGVMRIQVVSQINLKSGGVTPVKIFRDYTFDPSGLAVSTLRFGPAGAKEAH